MLLALGVAGSSALLLAIRGMAGSGQREAQGVDVRVYSPVGLEERFQPPPGIRWGYFHNADHARIRFSHVPAAGGAVKTTVVLLHGRGEFAEKYFETMRDMVARGCDVWQMDWRGYGGSDRYLAERERGHSVDVSHDTRDLEQFVETIVKRAPGGPLVMVAHSMGAHLGVRYLHDYPGRFTAAVLSSPFLSLAPDAAQGMPEWLVRGIIWSANSFGFGERWAKGNGPWEDKAVERLSHDPIRNEVQRRWSRASPVLRVGGVTNGWVCQYLRSFDVLSQSGYYSGIKLPLLLGSASDDIVTRTDVQAQACSQMPNCRLLRLDNAWHELFMESNQHRSRWLDAIFAFIEDRSPRAVVLAPARRSPA